MVTWPTPGAAALSSGRSLAAASIGCFRIVTSPFRRLIGSLTSP